MDNYVSLNKILNIVMQYCPDDDGSCSKANVDLREMLDEIEAIEIEDVKPVKYAEWIKDDDTGELICSRCYSGKPTKCVCTSAVEHKLANHEIRYCYFCGAKMRNGI